MNNIGGFGNKLTLSEHNTIQRRLKEHLNKGAPAGVLCDRCKSEMYFLLTAELGGDNVACSCGARGRKE